MYMEFLTGNRMYQENLCSVKIAMNVQRAEVSGSTQLFEMYCGSVTARELNYKV